MTTTNERDERDESDDTSAGAFGTKVHAEVEASLTRDRIFELETFVQAFAANAEAPRTSAMDTRLFGLAKMARKALGNEAEGRHIFMNQFTEDEWSDIIASVREGNLSVPSDDDDYWHNLAEKMEECRPVSLVFLDHSRRAAILKEAGFPKDSPLGRELYGQIHDYVNVIAPPKVETHGLENVVCPECGKKDAIVPQFEGIMAGCTRCNLVLVPRSKK